MTEPPKPHGPCLILASASRYKRGLLERLRVPFETCSPGTDETPRPREDAASLARRLAEDKAQAVAADHPGCVVVGADQVALLGQTLLGKPGNASNAQRQLHDCSGRQVEFLTAVSVIDARRGTAQRHLDRTTVGFRTLSESEVERYVRVERPFDCAGGFKAESLGIALFQRIDNVDPTALTGLPLIWLAGALRHCGFEIP